jgi:small subunit ribosomal protein S4
LGIPLTPKAAKVMEKKIYPPGEHGRRFNKNESVYKIQLREKQRLRSQYNVHEAQMRNYYHKAKKMTGNTGENLVQLMESRLDALVLRGGLAVTIYAARQYVNHGHILVNGRKVDIPSYRVMPGDVISVKEKSRQLGMFKDALEQALPPEYLSTSAGEMTITYNRLPKRTEVPIICDMATVIEFYTR